MNALLAAGIKGKRFGAGMASYPGKPAGGIAGMFAAKEKIKMNPVCVEAMKPFMKPGKVPPLGPPWGPRGVTFKPRVE